MLKTEDVLENIITKPQAKGRPYLNYNTHLFVFKCIHCVDQIDAHRQHTQGSNEAHDDFRLNTK